MSNQNPESINRRGDLGRVLSYLWWHRLEDMTVRSCGALRVSEPGLQEPERTEHVKIHAL